jgi:hypothetical protein
MLSNSLGVDVTEPYNFRLPTVRSVCRVPLLPCEAIFRPKTPPSPTNFTPKTLSTLVDTLSSQHREEKVDNLLNVVALAYEPLYPCDVAAIIGLKLDSEEMKKLCAVLAPFFADRSEHDKLILYHDKLEMYLQEKENKNNQSRATTHALFVGAFRPKGGDWIGANWSDLLNTRWKDWYPRWSPDPVDSNDPDKFAPPTVAPRYARRYLVHHTYELYQATDWSDPKRQQRANDFLNLVCNPGYRTVRLVEVGQEATVQDLWNGLRVIYTEYIHNLSPEKNNEKARGAFERLMAAHEPLSITHISPK